MSAVRTIALAAGCAALVAAAARPDVGRGVGSASAADAVAAPSRAAADVNARVGAPGAIVGRLVMDERAPRRVVNRYAGGPASAHVVEPVPAVAFLEGRIGRAASTTEPRRMAQADTTFLPSLLVVPAGATVRFPNRDPFFHNVFSFSRAKRFDLGRYPEGESKAVDFDEPGVVEVYCEIHKWMRAAIVVVENPFHAIVPEDGTFRIDGVPAGRYRLTVWEFDHGQKTLDVEVPSDGVARVEVAL